jgi:Zn-dependent protease/predicted transcriptional regulator
MRRGINLFKIKGIQISVDFSWLIIFFLFAWSLSTSVYSYELPYLNTSMRWVMGFITSFCLFVFVLAHEMSHSLVARRWGVKVSSIKLFIFGGVARITGEPQSPKAEFSIAVAGPIVSYVAAISMWLLSLVFAHYLIFPPAASLFRWLAVLNAVIATFNLIPGFPLDGGRILRSILWKTTGNFMRSTTVATSIGKIVAAGMVIYGVVVIILHQALLSGMWFVLLGLFLRYAAQLSLKQVTMREAFAGVQVGDAMTRDVISVTKDVALSELVHDYFLRYHFQSFPVVDAEGRFLGMVSSSQVKQVLRDDWPRVKVKDIMAEMDPSAALSPEDHASNALSRIMNSGAESLPVVSAGRVVGIFSRRDAMELLKVRTDLGQ